MVMRLFGVYEIVYIAVIDLPLPVLGFPNRSLLMSPPEFAELFCCCPTPGRRLFFLSFVMSSLNMSPVRNAEMRSSNSPSPFPLGLLTLLTFLFLLCENRSRNKNFEEERQKISQYSSLHLQRFLKDKSGNIQVAFSKKSITIQTEQ